MILERLVFENFRQFKGRQELIFSDLKDRNVTIVHAENGFGKTTILKGLLWVLYGRDGLMGTDGQPDDFEKPDRLMNESVQAAAKDPSEVEVAVELTFKHDNDRHILRRSLTMAQQNLDPKETRLRLETMRDGQTFVLDNPQQRIQSIIPEGIRKLLFFNGERINYLAMERSTQEVSEAIRQMLGLQLLETTIEDLKHQNVRGKLMAELRAQPTSEEKRELMDQRDATEISLNQSREGLQQCQRNLLANEEQIRLIEAKLNANQKAHELQRRRTELNLELEELRIKKTESSKKLARLIAEDGFMLFTKNLVDRGREIVARLRAEGKIPARVLNTFLKDLLDSESCICKRCLAPGTDERKAVEELLTIAGDVEFNNAVGALDHAMGVLEEGARKTDDQLRSLNRDRLEYSRGISEREEELERIHQQISGKDDDEAKDLEKKRSDLLLECGGQKSEAKRLEDKITSLQEKLEELGRKIRQMEDRNASANLAQRRLDTVEDAAKLLEKILEAETKDLRPLLNEEIAKHYRKIMNKDFWPELEEDFTLRIRKRVAGTEEGDKESQIDAALSTGERTVTSLVFIASLVALAERRSEIPTIVRGLSGSAYPIAIDSPFGSLSIFRSDVARYIPELAPQILLLVSPSQYDGDVHQALKAGGKVGRRYYLRFTGPTIPERANPDLTVDGQTLQQYFPSTEEEYSQICEL